MRRPELDVVRSGYDRMAEQYLAWAARIDDPTRLSLVRELDRLLAPGSSVLDLGCGAGVPSAATLAERHHVVGVDVSAEQIKLARNRVPAATFEQRDLLDVRRPPASLDAVTAFYSLIHVPRELHAELLARIHTWLRPDGLFLATLSASGTTDGVQDEFVGVPMYFSGFDADTNRRLIVEAGFRLLVDDVVTIDEPEGPATFLWVLARA